MILEDVVDYFREAPPLSLLEPGTLMDLARRAGLDFYPGDTPVLGPGQAGEGFVLVVKKGLLRVGGEVYGEGAVLGWSPGAGVVIEDAVCYLLPPGDVAEALRARPELLDFLEGRLSAQVLEIGLAGIVREIPAWLTRRPLATVSAGDVVRVGEPVPFDMSIRQAATVMTDTFRDALVVVGREGRPSGVVTDRDFRIKAVGGGMSPDAPVEELMSSPVVSVDAGSSCFDALMAMTRHHLRHVVVMAGRIPAGVLSAQELLLKQVGSPPALAARVARAATVEELAEVSSLLDQLALGLLREGARASSLGRIVGGLREALAARACQLAEEILGPPPCGYALMLLGRAARREGPALCPMWHAVVHECSMDARAADLWFERLGDFLGEALEIMHLSGAPGTPAAMDPAWRGTLEEWRERLGAWAAAGPGGHAEPGHFDFRPVHGQLWLAEALRSHLAGLFGASGLSGTAACAMPSDSNHGAGQDPEQDSGGDLAARLVDQVRAWAMCAGITRIASVERAVALKELRPVGPELAHALEYLTAWQWVGEPLRKSPMGKAMERMCRNAARRAHDEMVAVVKP